MEVMKIKMLYFGWKFGTSSMIPNEIEEQLHYRGGFHAIQPFDSLMMENTTRVEEQEWKKNTLVAQICVLSDA